jgi:aspartokinase
VSVVGDGLLGPTSYADRFRAILERLGAPPKHLTGTPLRLGAVIDSAHLAEAQRALHDAFVTS